MLELIGYSKCDWMKLAESVDWSTIWDQSRAVLLNEVYQANQRLLIDPRHYYSAEFFAVLVVMLANFAIDIIASFILSRRTKSTKLLFFAEVLGLSKVFLACFLPGSPMKLLCGLVIFASGLGVHARVCDQLQLNEERPDGSSARFFHEAFNTLYFNVLSRMGEFRGPRFPPLGRILHGLTLLVLIDLCTYIIREWIPFHVSLANQTVAMAIVGGVWTVYSMDFSYIMGASQSDVMGLPMSMELRHRHPLMSESLSEFWGIRWNPIVGKLLQDSFYKPCRRIGVSRAGCVIACFTGSAVLHAVPQYIATRSVPDCSMMFAFFFLQGVCLMIEVAVQKLCGFGKKKPFKKVANGASSPLRAVSTKSVSGGSPIRNKHNNGTNGAASTGATIATPTATTTNVTISTTATNVSSNTTLSTIRPAVPHHSVPYKTAPFQFPAELLTLVFILSTSYLVLEFLCVESVLLTQAQKEVWVKVAVSSFIGASVLYYFVRRSIYRALERRHKQYIAPYTDNNTNTNTNIYTNNTPTSRTRTTTKESTTILRMPWKTFFWSYLGWLWTLLVVVLLLPLFALPVLHAVQPLYSQSFVIGPIVRTLQQVVLPALAQHMQLS